MKTCFFSVSLFKEAVVVYFEAFSCILFIIVFRFVSTCHYLFSLHSDYKGVSESAGNGWYRNVPLLSASESSTFEFGQRATIWAPAGRNAETWLFLTFCRAVCDCSWISGTFWKRLRRSSDSLSSSVLPSRRRFGHCWVRHFLPHVQVLPWHSPNVPPISEVVFARPSLMVFRIFDCVARGGWPERSRSSTRNLTSE